MTSPQLIQTLEVWIYGNTVDLKAFGKTLRGLRKQAGLTQEQLALELPVAAGIISIWERAYQHGDRIWQPNRDSVVRLLEIFTDHLTPKEAQGWVAAAGYKLKRAELQEFFPAYAAQIDLEPPLPSEPRTNFARLIMPPSQMLFGVEAPLHQLGYLLKQEEEPWLMAIDGIGGIGKTSLASVVVYEMMPGGRFYDAAWLSAKQEEYRPGSGLQKTDQPALDIDILTDAVLEQLGDRSLLVGSAPVKLDRLITLLKSQSYLVVIDNLETVVDYEILLPLLRRLANPSKFLLTSRHNLRAHSDVYCLKLTELSRNDTFSFLKHEAKVRGLSVLAKASEAQLESIYEVVGGNPLALKLIVGQISVLPLSEVLSSLKEAHGKKTDDLYNYIYWKAWHNLDKASQKILLAMPLAQGGTLSQISALSRVEGEILNQALEHLVILSLVDIQGDIEQRRYFIHRLTETFLLTEVIKRW
jgi:transcriptional regulator with XRE-family HTH domain